MSVHFQPEYFLSPLHVHPTDLEQMPFSSIKWEKVFYTNKDGNRPRGLVIPKEEFMENIEDYEYNRFLDIGNFTPLNSWFIYVHYLITLQPYPTKLSLML